MPFFRFRLPSTGSLVFALILNPLLSPAQPSGSPSLPLSDIQPGMTGEVWTVFSGTQPEPFAVEVTGIVRNALGPGKSIIVCRLTDPRVQNMGAVAGMSGSPLYIGDRLAGALSYQLQRFETVRYAGFTPIEDLMEVSRLPGTPPSRLSPIELRGQSSVEEDARPDQPVPAATAGFESPFQPLTPVFTVSGLSPDIVALFEPRFRELGLNLAAFGGSYGAGDSGSGAPRSTLSTHDPEFSARNFPSALRPGDAVSVALSTGDITIAGTGTVSYVDGSQLLAFGHPLLRLGAVELPMAAAEVVAILPSQMISYKVANVGPVVGTISQDRLSAVYGELGRRPEMIPVEVTTTTHDSTRTLRFDIVRHPQISPLVATLGLAQGILGANDAGFAEGFRVRRSVVFPDGQILSADDLYPGPQGFAASLGDLLQQMGYWLQNPFEKIFPTGISFSVEALDRNPISVLDVVRLSRSTAAPADTVQITLVWRDYQGGRNTEVLNLPVDASWAGKKLDVVVATGPLLDNITGNPGFAHPSQLRSFDEYLRVLASDRRRDGLYVAVVEKVSLFIDQAHSTLDYPGSIERIARGADDSRFRRREAAAPLWETHLLAGRLIPANVRQPLAVAAN